MDSEIYGAFCKDRFDKIDDGLEQIFACLNGNGGKGLKREVLECQLRMAILEKAESGRKKEESDRRKQKTSFYAAVVLIVISTATNLCLTLFSS